MANCAGAEANVEVKGLMLVVLVDLVAYFAGELAKDSGGAESLGLYVTLAITVLDHGSHRRQDPRPSRHLCFFVSIASVAAGAIFGDTGLSKKETNISRGLGWGTRRGWGWLEGWS
jgi:hypothetical protein